GKMALAVAEERPVLGVGKRPALADERDGLVRFRGKLRVGDLLRGRLEARTLLRRRARREPQGERGEGGGEGALHRAATPARAALEAIFAVKRAASITWRSWRPSQMRSTPSCAEMWNVSLRPSTD